MLHIKSIKPLSTSIITTGNRYEEDIKENGIIVSKKGDLKLYQTVKAVGPMVRGVEVGDQVMINPAAYVRRKYSKDSIQNDMDNNPIMSVEFEWVSIDDEDGNPKDCLLLNDRDIRFVFEGEETNESIIIPNKPKLIVN